MPVEPDGMVIIFSGRDRLRLDGWIMVAGNQKTVGAFEHSRSHSTEFLSSSVLMQQPGRISFRIDFCRQTVSAATRMY